MPHCCGDEPPSFRTDYGENSSTATSSCTTRCRNCGGVTKSEAICDSCRFRTIVSERIIRCLREESQSAYCKARTYLELLIDP